MEQPSERRVTGLDGLARLPHAPDYLGYDSAIALARDHRDGRARPSPGRVGRDRRRWPGAGRREAVDRAEVG